MNPKSQITDYIQQKATHTIIYRICAYMCYMCICIFIVRLIDMIEYILLVPTDL